MNFEDPSPQGAPSTKHQGPYWAAMDPLGCPELGTEISRPGSAAGCGPA